VTGRAIGFLVLLALVGACRGPDASVSPGTGVDSPPAGSMMHELVLNAVRRELGITSTLQADHLRTWGPWAFVRANEVLRVGGERQETDLTVLALLARRRQRWYVVDSWTLPGDAQRPYAEFVRRVRKAQNAGHLPDELFPADL
jgi:hypothetical protein